MFGFLFSGALFGLATIGWPIYLHFRKNRNAQIQVVPSLRIFGFSRKRVQRLRLQQLLVLLARILVLLALFLLVAQPFCRTIRTLPLPLARLGMI